MTGIISDFFDQINAKSAHILTSTSETLSAMVEGSSYTGNFTVVPILDSRKEYIASYESTGITFTGDVFVTAVDNPAKVDTNGDYYINYLTGYYKVLAATGATPTASYYTFMPAISSVVDVELGAVEIKDSVSDDRANILTDNGAYPTGTTKGLNVFVGRYQSSPSTFDDGDAAPVLLDENGRIALSSDIEIGSVELKDGSGDTRANINVADTIRTIGTTVLAVQEIGSDGTVPPTGSLLTNAPFVKITDATTNVDVLPLVTGTTSTGLLSVAGEIVDFDTSVLEDPTPSMGILGMSSSGAKPILVDASGRTNIDIATQTLTAVKVSKDANANAVANPIFVELSNGSSAFTATSTGSSIALDVCIVSSVLPASGATEATLSSIDTNIDIMLLGDDFHGEQTSVTSGYTSGTCQIILSSACTNLQITVEGDDDIVYAVFDSVSAATDLADTGKRYKLVGSILGTTTCYTFKTGKTTLDFKKRNSDSVAVYVDAFL